MAPKPEKQQHLPPPLHPDPSASVVGLGVGIDLSTTGLSHIRSCGSEKDNG